MPSRSQTAQVANGTVRVGDWVRELPAEHFQPCDCCLCNPPDGVRPAWQVQRITVERGNARLWFGDDRGYPSDEYEWVTAPELSEEFEQPSAPGGPVDFARFLRDPAALARFMDFPSTDRD
jgi:hypothetical protein